MIGYLWSTHIFKSIYVVGDYERERGARGRERERKILALDSNDAVCHV